MCRLGKFGRDAVHLVLHAKGLVLLVSSWASSSSWACPRVLPCEVTTATAIPTHVTVIRIYAERTPQLQLWYLEKSLTEKKRQEIFLWRMVNRNSLTFSSRTTGDGQRRKGKRRGRQTETETQTEEQDEREEKRHVSEGVWSRCGCGAVKKNHEH